MKPTRPPVSKGASYPPEFREEVVGLEVIQHILSTSAFEVRLMSIIKLLQRHY